jgi:hypothetical protein
MTGVALIYVRRSMVRYEQDRPSPERQLANCVRLCEDKRGPRARSRAAWSCDSW